MMIQQEKDAANKNDNLKKEILKELSIATLSRELSIQVRKEVLSGRGKFGVGGAGMELVQLVMAKYFKKGDFWSGYYRDQTFMLAKDLANEETFFAALYGDGKNDPFSGARQMNNHYSTRLIDKNGNWINHTQTYNVASSMASLAAQVPHALGIALASKMFRESKVIKTKQFSVNGNEISLCVIGDSATSEGVFFEAINAAGVMQVPIAFIVLDNGYGISVPTKYQTTKESISKVLEGFRIDESGTGLDIYTAKGWDYEALNAIFEKGFEKIRTTHIPAIFHIQECTQPLGHSTSGSHQRYKSKERLAWEGEMDCNFHFQQWILKNKIATQQEIDAVAKKAIAKAKSGKEKAWTRFTASFVEAKEELLVAFTNIEKQTKNKSRVSEFIVRFKALTQFSLRELAQHAEEMLQLTKGENLAVIAKVQSLLDQLKERGHRKYTTHLHSSSEKSALQVPAVAAQYDADAAIKKGYEILNAFFDKAFEKDPMLFAFGEDVGHIGGVNQGFAGLQKKYGKERIFDTGIREWTIVGQAIGMAMRGLRPIAEMQYVDYLPYAFSALTDNLATLRYRSNNNQMAPAIIRTRGHRLEGIWHSGSPMGMLINSMRGIYLLTPRNMTQAAGMYNTMLQSDDPAIIIECLNGYRVKEKLPNNLDTFTVPLGVPEILRAGTDVTLVTYGSCVRIAQVGIARLNSVGISVELIDVQTLLPFDLEHQILDSLKKTNRIVFMDEDVPGGATAYMMQEVLEKQNGYLHLDSPPKTITSQAHRPAYANDGDYFSKSNADDVFKVIYQMMQEAKPDLYL